MTPCPQCGQLNNPGATACMRCGAQMIPPSFGQERNGDQLPEWLRQAAPPAQPPAFGAPSAPASFNQGLGGQQAPYGQFSSGPLGAPPNLASGALSARSLMSEDALPEWLRSAGASMPGGQAGSVSQQPPTWNEGQQPAWNSEPLNPYTAQPQQPQRPFAPPPAQTPRGSALFDDSALPEWLRQVSRGQELEDHPSPPFASPFAQPAAPSMPSSGQHPAQWQQSPAQPSRYGSPAFPGIEQAGQFAPPSQQGGGFNAASLVDPSALPPWLGGRPDSGVESGQPHSGDLGAMRARSLLEDSALPQWLRAEADSAAPAAPPPPEILEQNRGWIAPAASIEQPPAWLHQVYSEANVQPLAREPEPPAAPVWGQAAPPAANRLSAADFIDESALPDWLRAQGPAQPEPRQFPAQQLQQSAPLFAPEFPPAQGFDQMQGSATQPAPDHYAERADPPVRFSASDLIDPSAMPAWVTEQNDTGQMGFSSTAGWTNKAPVVQPQATDSNLTGRIPGAQPPAAWDAPTHRSSQMPSQHPLEDEPTSNIPAWLLPTQQPPAGAQPPIRPDESDGWNRPQVTPSARDFGAPAPDSQQRRRRGPPIPVEELPPWLQDSRFGPPQRSGPSQGWQRARPAQREQPWGQWNTTENAAEPWNSADGLDNAQQGKGRGWRRFFGKR